MLGLAVAGGALDAAAAWELSRIDETWQAEHWGLDPEAEAAAAARRDGLPAAPPLLALLRAGCDRSDEPRRNDRPTALVRQSGCRAPSRRLTFAMLPTRVA